MSEAAEPLIALTRVSKDYISEAAVVRALRDVSLTVERGDFLAIVGTSGSGKSTLMNILGCLDRPTRGTYHLAGLDVGTRSNDGRALVRNRLIGFIFQGFNLLPRTTALENVELPLTYRGVPAKERRRRAMAALDAVGLGDRVHHTPNQLSGGQQQRVAIARALVTDPPLLLADEPTGNLDTRTSYEVLALLQRLNRDLGITICLVTHEQDIAACASRAIVVRDGRIESDTRPEKPLDAAAALAELPPVDAAAAGPAEETLDPAEAARARLGGPVPFAVYGAMIAGLALGVLSGLLYDGAILGEVGPVIPGALGLVGEAWAGARSARRRLGRPLTNDQRGRVALSYTVATTAAWALFFGWLALPKLPPSRVDAMVGGRAVAVLGVIVLMVAAASLLRFLTLAAAASVLARRSGGATRARAAAS